ncbi:MAG: ABC transporter permease, partial [Bacteroidota bacterium]|nr:ABC transporter permease [Bacteroidota bacterium]
MQSEIEKAGVSREEAGGLSMLAPGENNFRKAGTFLSKYGIYFAFLLLTAVLSIISPPFLTPSNIINILRQISVNGIIAVGMTLVIITAGID